MSGKILITRPQEAGARFGDVLKAAGFDPLFAPMLEAGGRSFVRPDLSRYQALIFTSANGVRFFCDLENRRDIPVYVVGRQTAEAARMYGFHDVFSADGDVDALLDMMTDKAMDPVLPLLYVRGVDVARDLGKAMAGLGFEVEALVVYGAALVGKIEQDVIDRVLEGEVQAVTFFSKRTAKNFVQQAVGHRIAGSLAAIKVLCLSQGVLECVQPISWLDTYVCDRPNGDSMLDLLQRVCVASNTKPNR